MDIKESNRNNDAWLYVEKRSDDVAQWKEYLKQITCIKGSTVSISSHLSLKHNRLIQCENKADNHASEYSAAENRTITGYELYGEDEKDLRKYDDDQDKTAKTTTDIHDLSLMDDKESIDVKNMKDESTTSNRTNEAGNLIDISSDNSTSHNPVENKIIRDKCFNTANECIVLTIQCGLCCDTFDNEKKFDIHLNDVHEFISKTDEGVSLKMQRSSHIPKELNFDNDKPNDLRGSVARPLLSLKKYSCRQCDYKSKYRSKMLTHVNSKHLKIKEFKCSQCKKAYFAKQALEIHTRTIHLKVKDYKCNDCNKAFSRKPVLDEHVRYVHEKIRNRFICKDCNKGFYYKNNLDRHRKSLHLKIKDHQCIDCQKSFSEKLSLDRHNKIVHSNIKDYLCTECSKGFPIKYLLDQHVKYVHEKIRKFVCEFCDYVLSSKQNFKSHVNSKH